jgi:histidinol-phosphate/aromatic aminotransferase/cobyric acid decarboxylase-like protein
MQPAFHGGRTGDTAIDDAVDIDFSTNVNAFGPPDAVRSAIENVDLAAYPDPEANAPRSAFAAWCGVAPERVAFTAGACDALHRIARAYLTDGDTALIAAPGFGEYARAATMSGAAVRAMATQGTRSDPPIELLLDAVHRLQPRLVLVASPSSPLGCRRPTQELAALADALGGHGLLVLDDSYITFAGNGPRLPALLERDDVIHVRSITKDFALAGVRAGFVIASAAVAGIVRNAGPAWNTSSVAQAAAAAAFTQSSLTHVTRTIQVLRTERQRLAHLLTRAHVTPLAGDTHILCLQSAHAHAWTQQARRHRLRVRSCASFGWPDVVRVAARTPAENDLLIAAFREETEQC